MFSELFQMFLQAFVSQLWALLVNNGKNDNRTTGQGLTIHRRLMYQQNFTTYAIFREDECFMRGGEYNANVMAFYFALDSDTQGRN